MVPARSLAVLVERWIRIAEAEDGWDKDWNAAREYGFSQYGVIQYLADQSGVDPRVLYRIREGNGKFISLVVAEKLVIKGMGWEHVFHTGELPVVPNPRWSQERWANYMASRGCNPDEL